MIAKRPKTASYQRLKATDQLFRANSGYIEALYEQFQDNPQSISGSWRAYLDALEQLGLDARPEVTPVALPASRGKVASGSMMGDEARQSAVLRLINAYRFRGHQGAAIDPLGLRERIPPAELDPAYHGLGEADLDCHFYTGSLVAPDILPLRDILALLKEVYAGSVGADYMHITETAEKRWIQQRLEGERHRFHFEESSRVRILHDLTSAEGLERYLHSRFVGQKRFSLEGGEALIPLLNDLIQQAGTAGIQDVVMGMAHRGRLNVLVNVMGKFPSELFAEFEGKHKQVKDYTGDVKYHLGFFNDVHTPGGNLRIALAFNPSHLEIVAPVVEGSVRARQQRYDDDQGNRVLPVVIHGDSAFAGQGVVQECFNLSQARGYSTGGTVHIVVNNQIGFTTSNPLDTRSMPYCTDVAKMVQAPVFHVNGDDPEAVIAVTRIALEYRMQFHRDVVIDLVCYRRQGHNEADEPAATQPMMYRIIRSKPTPRQIYANLLKEQGIVQEEDVSELQESYRLSLDHGAPVIRNQAREPRADLARADWRAYADTKWTQKTDTGIPLTELQALGERLNSTPEGFELHPRVAAIYKDRAKMAAGALPVDWGFAELLAYGSLIQRGIPVRVSGQDSGRGTFFHRHAVLHNQQNGATHVPLQTLSDRPSRLVCIDSVLSEEAVLGYEYGFASSNPEGLTIWEAQFGDFTNGAQVVIDQFISSGETKWGRLCGLTLFLPHGFEGQGPEHSSARVERFLQLCAQENMQIVIPTNAAQMFHLLRRQVLRPYRKPLIVFTAKSLLRHRLSVSQLDELANGRFHTVIPETQPLDPAAVTKVIFCTGKVYYDLLKEREDRERQDVAIVRIEQLYPFPVKLYKKTLQQWPNARDIVWCQEEPMNQGAWYNIQHRLVANLGEGQQLRYTGRPASAAPATGYHNVHVAQLRAFLEEAFGTPPSLSE
jgi:2-oxoglutarate dehydrogenase E1 component